MGSQKVAESKSPDRPSTLEFVYEPASRRYESSQPILQGLRTGDVLRFHALTFANAHAKEKSRWNRLSKPPIPII